MDWLLPLLVILGGLVVLMTTGLPVAFCFAGISILGVLFFGGGESALRGLALSFYSSLTSFVLMPLPLFILMGEVTFRSGVGSVAVDTLDKWLGRVRGRLGLVAVGAGTLLSTLTGTSVSSVAILGSTLAPEMERRGYKKPMTLGPILGSGGLALMIPPSGLAVFIAAISLVSIGETLIAIIIPGLLMATLYAVYIILRCRFDPSLAPGYEVWPLPLSEKLLLLAKNILPIGFIVFLVVGFILIGVATPSEAAATGALGCFLLAAAYRRLNWQVIKKSVSSALVISTMILLIIMGAQAFSELLSYSGVIRGVVKLVTNLPVAPIMVFIVMQAMLLFLGMFIPTAPMAMILLPLYMPIILALGFDPVWFLVIFLLGLEMAQTSPPYGISLFVMKELASPGTTIGDCYRAALPFLGCDAIAMAFIIAFPQIALWLPSVMR